MCVGIMELVLATAILSAAALNETCSAGGRGHRTCALDLQYVWVRSLYPKSTEDMSTQRVHVRGPAYTVEASIMEEALKERLPIQTRPGKAWDTAGIVVESQAYRVDISIRNNSTYNATMKSGPYENPPAPRGERNSLMSVHVECVCRDMGEEQQ